MLELEIVSTYVSPATDERQFGFSCKLLVYNHCKTYTRIYVNT